VAVDDFDDGYGDPSDYGMSQSDFDTATSIGQAVYSGNDDNIAQAIANATAQPRVGSNRSNITNLVDSSGNSLYDPQFAAALDITRGLDPTNNMGGTGGLAVPSYLRPQLTGDIASDPRGSFNLAPKYFSPVERFLQEDATNFIRSAQESAAGIPSLLSTGVGLIKNVFDGLSFLNDSKAGKTIEKVVEDEKRIEIADLEKERLEEGLNTNINAKDFLNKEPFSLNTNINAKDFLNKEPFSLNTNINAKDFLNKEPYPSITKTNLDRNFKTEPTNYLDYGLSLATEPNLSPDYVSRMRAIDALPPYQRPANNIFENLEKETANVEIDAGDKKGQTLSKVEPTSNLYDGSQYNDLAMQSLKNLGYNVEVPNLPNVFPVSRPFPGTDEVGLRSSPDGYYFANAFNRPLDPSRTYRVPIDIALAAGNEQELREAEEFNYSLSPIPKDTDPIQFIKKKDLPSDLQGIVSLNTDLDYGPTTPLGYYFDQTARGKAEERARLEKIRKEEEALANIPRFYPYSATEGLPGLY